MKFLMYKLNIVKLSASIFHLSIIFYLVLLLTSVDAMKLSENKLSKNICTEHWGSASYNVCNKGGN